MQGMTWMLKLGLIPNHTNNIYIKTFHKSSRTVERAMWLRGFPNIMRIFFQINILMYKLRNKSRSGWYYLWTHRYWGSIPLHSPSSPRLEVVSHNNRRVAPSQIPEKEVVDLMLVTWLSSVPSLNWVINQCQLLTKAYGRYQVLSE